MANHGRRLGKQDEDGRLDQGNCDHYQGGDPANLVEALPGRNFNFLLCCLNGAYLCSHFILLIYILSPQPG